MRPAKLLRVAKWEVTKNAGGVDRKTIVVMALAILAMGSVAAVAVSGGGPGLNADIYRIGVEESNPYYEVASEDPSFRVQNPDPEAFRNEKQELTFFGPTELSSPQTEKQAAALEALRSSTESYNDRRMVGADNQTAAFPVSVTLVYQEQNGTSALDTGTDNDGGPTGDGSGTESPSSSSVRWGWRRPSPPCYGSRASPRAGASSRWPQSCPSPCSSWRRRSVARCSRGRSKS